MVCIRLLKPDLKVINPSEDLWAIKGLKVDKVTDPNGIPNQGLGHFPKCAIIFLTKVFDAVLLRQYWKFTCVASILKPRKDPTILSSYGPISLLDTRSNSRGFLEE